MVYASALGARGPGFNPWLWQGFLCLICYFVVVVFFCQNKNYVNKLNIKTLTSNIGSPKILF